MNHLGAGISMSNRISRVAWKGSVIRTGLLAIVFLAAGKYAGAQAARDSGDTGRIERREEMKGMVQSLRVARIDGGKRAAAEMRSEPLQRWNDPTREFSDGSLWLWTREGRPVAAVAVELYFDRERGPNWSHELVSLSTGLIEMEGGEGIDPVDDEPTAVSADGRLSWQPKSPGVEFKDILGAQTPGTTEPARLRQMKALAERFTGDEYYEPTKQTYSLRLLPRPVHRYANPEAGLIDGTIFFIAHGTNPEIFLLIEAQGKTAQSAVWRYGLARLTTAAPTVRLDQKVVWTRPFAQKPIAADPYFIVHKPRAKKPTAVTPANDKEVKP